MLTSNRINQTEFDLYLAYISNDKRSWITLDSAVVVDYNANNKTMIAEELTFGRNVHKYAKRQHLVVDLARTTCGARVVEAGFAFRLNDPGDVRPRRLIAGGRGMSLHE